MSTDPKKSVSPSGAAAARAEIPKKVRIFSYPKIVYLYPTMIVSFLCALIMWTIKDRELNVKSGGPGIVKPAQLQPTGNNANPPTNLAVTDDSRPRRSTTIQNLAGLLFLGVLGFNLIVMALDFPRFTIFAGILFGAAGCFLLLWLSTFFRILPVFLGIVEYLYPVANHQFYFLVALTLLLCYLAVFATRYLDYWVITPNEILHNHGPFSDLERYPTFNLKFDKEIPDILEYIMLGSGKLVLHVTNERTAFVLENVPFISRKEVELKQMMSSMEVRVTDDRQAPDV